MPVSSTSSPQLADDAWEDKDISGGHSLTAVASLAHKREKLATRLEAYERLYNARLQPSQRDSLPSLQALCLGCLATYISDVLELEQEFLASLPWVWKAPLLAVARRKGLVNDEILWKLSDSEADTFDISRCPHLTHDGIHKALQAVPNLRHLDMQRCNYRPSLLGSLKDLCPQLESLRIGGFSKKEPAQAIRGSKQEKAAVSALLQCLPHIVDQAVQDSWEDDEQEEKEIAALYKLQLLVWPDLDMLNHEALRRAAPQVRIVTVETEELPSGKASSAALTEPLDSEYAALVAQQRVPGSKLESWDSEGAGWEMRATARTYSGPSLAERFRAAYKSRTARIALVREKNAEKERRRELRAMTSSARALRMAEDDDFLAAKVGNKMRR